MQLAYPLPLEWSKTDEGKTDCHNDQKWLNGVTQNAAPFSDWWAKARVIQLAYRPMHEADPKIYQGLTTVDDIRRVLFEELYTHCQTRDEAQCTKMYPGFFKWVTAEFIIETLTYWKNKQFTKAISRNFEVYRYIEQRDPSKGDRVNRNTFLVVSTAPISLSANRRLPHPQKFRPLFNVDELADLIQERRINAMTLRTHGYANPAHDFFEFLTNEANALFDEATTPEQSWDIVADDHLYIGYHWPSEFPLFNRGLIQDSLSNIEILLKFLVSLFLLSLLPTVALLGLLVLGGVTLGFQWIWIMAGVYILWLSLFSLLRGVVYQRDRYRAVHYGAPDLAEFFWRLDRRLTRRLIGSRAASSNDMSAQAERILARKRLRVNLIGHSMGGLVLVNMLRVLSDRFGKDDQLDEQAGQFGDCLILGKMILASPDIPLELIREGRNNYVRSAMRRCEQIYLMSSDRDIVLRYLSTLGNWFTEPSVEMSGLRLGNLFLPPDAERVMRQRNKRGKRESLKILLVRGAVISRSAVRPTSAYDLFENITYLDCSKMKGVNATTLDLNPLTAIPIDLITALFYVMGRIDAHGGYFFTYTPSFKLMPFLMQAIAPTEEEVRAQIDRWDPRRRMIRFLYRMSPTPGGNDSQDSSNNNKQEAEVVSPRP
ncbi:MAG: alpha/beta hydrolase [Cyanobacteria bacterium J06638_22]